MFTISSKRCRTKRPIISHAGDGNFHVCILFDPKNPKEVNEMKRLNGNVIERAMKLGGTCTGEHGVGMGKKDYLEKEIGEGGVRLMKAIKLALDPNNIFNPDKKVPDVPSIFEKEGERREEEKMAQNFPSELKISTSLPTSNFEFDPNKRILSLQMNWNSKL